MCLCLSGLFCCCCCCCCFFVLFLFCLFVLVFFLCLLSLAIDYSLFLRLRLLPKGKFLSSGYFLIGHFLLPKILPSTAFSSPRVGASTSMENTKETRNDNTVTARFISICNERSSRSWFMSVHRVMKQERQHKC